MSIYENRQIVSVLDELTKTLTPDDVALLQALLKQSEGNELDTLMDLMGYTYQHKPVGVREFVESPRYLGLAGQVYPVLLDDLEELFEGDYIEAVLTGGIGWGKALGLDTRIPTPTGWTTMKDVSVGDYVLSDTGKPCKVINATEVQYGRPCYKVLFSDGESVIADAEHKWLVSAWIDRARASKRGVDPVQRVVTTEEMAKSLWHGRMRNWAIELSKPIDLPEKDLVVPPYVLGAWLGDGTADEGVITCHDLEIVEKIRACGYTVKEHKATPGRFSILGLKAQLRGLGVLGNKHIPIEYLRGSIEQRTELLCGLMDTDGSIEIGGRAEFTSTNKVLAEGVYELIASLGHKPVFSSGKAKIGGKYCGKKYRVRFTPDVPVFCLSRKLNRQRTPGKQGSRNKRRYVVDIVPVESVPVRCIEVDSPSRLFLFGRTFIPTHNSTFAEIAICRMIYEVSCFRNPQKVYGLRPGSVIAFINVSVNKTNAKKVVFQGIKSTVLNSPYFREQFPIVADKAEELRFPNNIWIFPAAAGESGIIGYNVFGGVMDEVNFMAYSEKSAVTGGEKYDQAQTLQEALLRRMKSRFIRQGSLPGILIQVSSSKYPDDYTERRIKEAQDDPQIFVRRYAQWDTYSPEVRRQRFSGKMFFVTLGNLTQRPKMHEDKETAERVSAEEGCEYLEVPIEYKRDFERDIDRAIRDLAGRPTLTITPFITYRWKVREAMDRGEKYDLVHPYSSEYTNLKDGAVFEPKKLLLPKYARLLDQLDKGTEEWKRVSDAYKHLRHSPRFIHCDLALTNDAAGIAMGFVYDYTVVVRRNEEGNEFRIKVPVIMIDFMLQIRAPEGGEIELAGVRNLIYELRSYGYRIKKVTFDQFQSADSMQILRNSGIATEQLSADTNPEVYGALKDALYEDRLIMYPYEIAYNEIVRLERNERTGKVDHPPQGSKDVSDAIAAVCYHCVNEKDFVPLPPPMRGVLDRRLTVEEEIEKEMFVPIMW